ncbi:MAG: hypothetical protein R3B09_35800 [Nannocystaceae bacterium]
MPADLKTLLKGSPVDAFTAKQLASKAHWRWDRDQHDEAFVLFDAARERAASAGEVNEELSARNRAALTRHRSGVDPADGLHRLEEVLAIYEARPDLDYDRHFCEWAASDLILEAATRGREAFVARFTELRARVYAMGLTRFPRIHPQQEALAREARRLEAEELLRLLIPAIRGRKRTRSLRQELAAWEAWLAARPTP